MCVILHLWNEIILVRKSCGKCPREAPTGFVSVATRFQHLLDEGEHHHCLSLLPAEWEPRVCVCLLQKWFSSEHKLVFKHCWCSGSLKYWSWSKIMNEGEAGEILCELSGFPFAVASLFSVRWIHISSLAFSWSLLSNSRHHQHPLLLPEQPHSPSAKGFPVHFKSHALPSPSPC